MNKTVIIIVLVAVVVIGYLLVNEFSGGETVQPAPAPQAAVQEPNVQQAEEEQISREIESQSQSALLSKEYRVKCAPCHNRDGSGPVGAVIKGMSKEALVESLTAYKNGTKENTLMAGLMKNVSDEEIERLSEEISRF
jgi:cytochrome c553